MITDEAKIAKALAYAEHIVELRKRKEGLEEDIAATRDQLHSTASTLGVRIITSPSADGVPNAVIRIREMISAYINELIEYLDELRRFRIDLTRIPPVPARVLSLRYVHDCEWPEVAACVGYSERHTFRVRDEGLVALYDVMPETWRSSMVPDALE